MAHGHVFVLRRLACRPGRESGVSRGAALAWRNNSPCVDDLCAVGVDDFNGLLCFQRHRNARASRDGMGCAWRVFGRWKGRHRCELDFFRLIA